jgi:excisionase family DNA binding protein
MPTSTPEKLLLSAREAAKALSVSERTLWSMTAPRGPIPAVKIGTRVLYSVTALQKWIDAQAVVGGQAHE